MTDKPHISATQIEMLSRCGEQYRRRYIEGERIPPGVAMLLGTAIHKGAETNFGQKITSHIDLPASQIIDASVAGFEQALAGGYVLTDDEGSRGAKVVLGEAKDKTAALAEVHAQKQAPAYQPVEVEKVTRILFPSATHDLLAICDLRDNRDRVIDIKTAGRKKQQKEADTSTQLTIYAAAFQVDNGIPPKELRLDTLVKTKKPGRQVLRTNRTPADMKALVNRINAILASIATGVFAPCPPGSWQCDPRYCGYWSTCEFVNSERRDQP